MRVAAVLALLALVVAPVAEAATHGPAAVTAQAEPVVGQVEAGGHRQDHGLHDAHGDSLGHSLGHGAGHGPQDAADHDHSASVILCAAPVLVLPQGKAEGVALARQCAGTTADGPRRPPRV